ncbi:hypothetical protein [uncultured Megasphaera sp.]|uniref:hypothetical protein n=1 Tax=uncultured Megasphaera sp. TaxID=165188 RepID=UPI00266D94F9|nr:hypothetical protein [uncultured Megasphaera sp.]
MSIQASWLDKKWTIDINAVNGLDNLSIKKELDVEENDSKDGQNPTNTKGYKPQGLTTTHKVSFAAGTNPRQEYKAWQERVGKRAGFHINGTRFGPPVLILDKVEFKASHISNTGQILEADITLTFSEDVNQAKAPAAAVELYFGDIAVPETTPGYNPNAAQTVKSAYNVRPSASAAAEKS